MLLHLVIILLRKLFGKILTDKEKESNKKLFAKFSRHLREECNKTKDFLKAESLGGIDNRYALKKTLSPCVEYYLKNVENAKDITVIKSFLTSVYTSLINHYVLYNKEMNKKTFNSTITHDELSKLKVDIPENKLNSQLPKPNKSVIVKTLIEK